MRSPPSRYLLPVHFSPAPSPLPRGRSSGEVLWVFLSCFALRYRTQFSLYQHLISTEWVVRCTETDKRCGGTAERREKKYIIIIIHDTVFILALPPSLTNVSSFLSPSSFLLAPSVSVSTNILTKRDPCQQKSQHALIPRQNCWERLLYCSASVTHWPRRRKLWKFFSPVKLEDLQFVKNTFFLKRKTTSDCQEESV